MSMYISGSLAFDRITYFKGLFQDHILKEKLHMINVCFPVDNMAVRRGGCAGNIAYTLALMGEKPVILSTAGKDFAEYGQSLKDMGLPMDGIQIDENVFTATCYIINDLANNQILSFYAGAMMQPSTYAFPGISEQDYAIVAPGNMEDMRHLPEIYRAHKVRYLFDPGQQISLFSKDLLTGCINGAFAYISNEYELSLTCKLLELEKEEDLFDKVEYLITTLAEKGCRVRGRDGTDVTVPAIPCEHVVDPTGAGDTLRSGLLFGLSHGLSVAEAIKYGVVTASYVIACQGTQEHSFTAGEFRARYEQAFGPMPVAF